MEQWREDFHSFLFLAPVGEKWQFSQNVYFMIREISFLKLRIGCWHSPRANTDHWGKRKMFFYVGIIHDCSVVMHVSYSYPQLFQVWFTSTVTKVNISIAQTSIMSTVWMFKLLAPDFFFNFSTPVYKMLIIQEPNMLELWNKLHFEEKNMESINHV